MVISRTQNDERGRSNLSIISVYVFVPLKRDGGIGKVQHQSILAGAARLCPDVKMHSWVFRGEEVVHLIIEQVAAAVEARNIQPEVPLSRKATRALLRHFPQSTLGNKHGLCLIGKAKAKAGRMEFDANPFEQSTPELALELVDRGRDCLRGNAEMRCGPSHAAIFQNGI